MPGRVSMHDEARRGLDCEGVPCGTSKQGRPKGDEVRRERLWHQDYAIERRISMPFSMADSPAANEMRT